MSDDIPSIHEFDLSLICEYFADLDRQGPSSPEVTTKVLSYSDLDETKPQQGATDVIDPCCANTEPAMKAVATMLA